MRVNAGFVPADHWVHSEDEGRSRIVGEMSHFIDLLQALTGSLVQRVIAERVSGDNQAIVNNDNVVISLKFRDGSVGNLAYSASELKPILVSGLKFSVKDKLWCWRIFVRVSGMGLENGTLQDNRTRDGLSRRTRALCQLCGRQGRASGGFRRSTIDNGGDLCD